MRGIRRQSIGLLVAIGLTAAACGGGASDGVGPSDPTTTTADPVVMRDAPGSDHVESLAAGLNDAGFDVFSAVAATSTEDVIVSPLSIGLAFGMADVGATGETATALEDLFGYPVDGEERWSAFNTLDQSVTDVGAPIVRLANRMIPDESFDTVDGYEETLARFFGTMVETLPLQRESENSRQRINEWIADRTEDLIPDLLPAGAIDNQTVLLLVNALYFEADWARPFGKYPTEDAGFTLLDGIEVTVPMMHERELPGPAVVTDAYAATEVPYEGGVISMLVIVPEQGRFEEVQAELSNDLVSEIDDTATTGNVELFLPRFESATHLDLRSLLEEDLGVDGLFDIAGGWDGIAPGIFLESAVHAADISVDEYGTVAAAATALNFGDSGPPETDVVVRADRPFLYLIRHTQTEAVLFVGRVVDPSS